MLACTMHQHCQGEANEPDEAVWCKVQRSGDNVEKYLQFYRGSTLEATGLKADGRICSGSLRVE